MFYFNFSNILSGKKAGRKEGRKKDFLVTRENCCAGATDHSHPMEITHPDHG